MIELYILVLLYKRDSQELRAKRETTSLYTPLLIQDCAMFIFAIMMPTIAIVIIRNKNTFLSGTFSERVLINSHIYFGIAAKDLIQGNIYHILFWTFLYILAAFPD